MDINDLLKSLQFRFETRALGELICNNFPMAVMRKSEKWLTNNETRDSVVFARYFTTLLCQPVDKEEDENYRINERQAELLTHSELEYFARLFVANNIYRLDDKYRQKKIREKNDEEVVVSAENHISDEFLKKSDESEADHLLRFVELLIAQSKKKSNKLFGNSTKGLFSSATLGLLAENERISNSLGSSLIHHESFNLPELPENPIFETNRQLAFFGKELNETASLIKNLNDLAVQMAMDSVRESARTKFWNNIMFGLGLITLCLTALVSYLGYTSSSDSSSQIEELLVEQNALLEKQEENQKKLIQAMSSIPPVLDEVVLGGRDQEEDLHRIFTQLNSIINQSSSKTSASSAPRSGASD